MVNNISIINIIIASQWYDFLENFTRVKHLMNALGTVNDGEFEKMVKASKALKTKVNRDQFPKSPVIIWKMQGTRPVNIVLYIKVQVKFVQFRITVKVFKVVLCLKICVL